MLSKPEYVEQTAATRDARMAWWREARYGLFIHYGLYAQLGRGEWAMATEGIPVAEYEKLADTFSPRVGAADEWAALAAAAGMKYAVLTTRHHEGFSLWDSKVNPFNSVNYGPKRDVVREFVDACRKRGVRVGFYSSLMDWRHPDGGAAAYDALARRRFLDYIFALNEELLTNYGKIDLLWYDAGFPMETGEGWDALALNQRMRELQPDIIINDRTWTPEDYDTPEGKLASNPPAGRDWEACMTFNNISWGYVDSAQAAPGSYNAQRILHLLAAAAMDGGNLLLNIGPTPDGSVPEETRGPLEGLGRWLQVNGEAVYGSLQRSTSRFANSVSITTHKGNTVYVVNGIWPKTGAMTLGGFHTRLKSARLVDGGAPIQFTQKAHQIILEGLPETSPDKILGVAVIALEFEEPPKFTAFPICPAMNGGRRFDFPINA